MVDGTPAPFQWRLTADGRVRISWHGREVTVLAGERAGAFLRRIASANAAEVQLALARVTGNFKRGNERTGKRSRRA
jgi:hypothetical protein